MAVRQKKRSKRKKVRYNQVKFKLTSHQKKSLENYCYLNNTTPIQAIKDAIRDYTQNYRKKPEEPNPRQLDLFAEYDKQLSLFDD